MIITIDLSFLRLDLNLLRDLILGTGLVGAVLIGVVITIGSLKVKARYGVYYGLTLLIVALISCFLVYVH